MYLYSNTGRAVLVNGRQIGSGWGIYNDIVGTGDGNGDRMADFVASQYRRGGLLLRRNRMKDQGYGNARKIGEYGWGAFNALVAVQDFNGDGKGDLLARKPDGTLWFYPGNGTGAYGIPKKIGDYGWEAFDAFAGVGDFNGDGKNDLVARKPDGTLWLYPGTGRVDAGSNGYAGRKKDRPGRLGGLRHDLRRRGSERRRTERPPRAEAQRLFVVLPGHRKSRCDKQRLPGCSKSRGLRLGGLRSGRWRRRLQR